MTLEILVTALATWRLTSLVMYEKGPFNLFGRFRQQITGKIQPVDPEEPELPFFEELLSCVMCFSVWTGFAAAVLSLPVLANCCDSFLSGLVCFILLPFAYSTSTIFLDSFFSE